LLHNNTCHYDVELTLIRLIYFSLLSVTMQTSCALAFLEIFQLNSKRVESENNYMRRAGDTDEFRGDLLKFGYS
jgi:hypothetical protein